MLRAMDARPPAYALVAAELLAACAVETFRSHGPGGQHANKTESAVRVTHRASGVTAQCQDHRERARNQAEALRRLRLRLALHERGASRPEWLAEQRRGTRIALGPGSDSYPLVVAVLLDALVAAAGALAQAAAIDGPLLQPDRQGPDRRQGGPPGGQRRARGARARSHPWLTRGTSAMPSGSARTSATAERTSTRPPRRLAASGLARVEAQAALRETAAARRPVRAGGLPQRRLGGGERARPAPAAAPAAARRGGLRPGARGALGSAQPRPGPAAAQRWHGRGQPGAGPAPSAAAGAALRARAAGGGRRGLARIRCWAPRWRSSHPGPLRVEP